MTDIVERLRRIAMARKVTRALKEAADEIERLRHVEADHKQLLERLRALLADAQ